MVQAVLFLMYIYLLNFWYILVITSDSGPNDSVWSKSCRLQWREQYGMSRFALLGHCFTPPLITWLHILALRFLGLCGSPRIADNVEESDSVIARECWPNAACEMDVGAIPICRSWARYPLRVEIELHPTDAETMSLKEAAYIVAPWNKTLAFLCIRRRRVIAKPATASLVAVPPSSSRHPSAPFSTFRTLSHPSTPFSTRPRRPRRHASTETF